MMCKVLVQHGYFQKVHFFIHCSMADADNVRTCIIKETKAFRLFSHCVVCLTQICHELARGIYIIREVYIAMFVIRIIQLTIAFNHSYHTCKFDIDWISILLKISKINANFDFIAACSSSPSLLLLPFASCS